MLACCLECCLLERVKRVQRGHGCIAAQADGGTSLQAYPVPLTHAYIQAGGSVFARLCVGRH